MTCHPQMGSAADTGAAGGGVVGRTQLSGCCGRCSLCMHGPAHSQHCSGRLALEGGHGDADLRGLHAIDVHLQHSMQVWAAQH